MKEQAESVKLLAAARPQPPLRKFFPKNCPTVPQEVAVIPAEGEKPGQRSQQPGSNPPPMTKQGLGRDPVSTCIALNSICYQSIIKMQ